MNKLKKQANSGFRHENHRLVSRRDFLGQGFLSGVGMVMSPGLLGLLGQSEAMAQSAAECGIATGGAGKIPFICFDLAGGASVAGSNVIVGGAGGQMDFISLEGYQKLGLPADMAPQMPGQVNTELGLAFHSDSAFLRGIRDKTLPSTRSNINGTVICARSDNDTGNNPHNPMYGINKAGADGDLVALIGTRNSQSGGKSAAPASMLDPTIRPTKIDRPRDATSLVDLGGLVNLLEPNDAAALMQAIERIGQAKISKINEQDLVKNLISCAYSQSTDLVSRYGDPAALDPLSDPAITGTANSIFTSDEVNSSTFRKTSAVMKLVVNGYAGAGTIELGGYDYHDSTRSKGEQKDFEAGQAMGATLEYAARIGQPLMLYVFSDGSVSSNGDLDESAEGRGKGIWKGDNASTASVIVLVYDPNGSPQLTRPDANQLGYFRASGAVETAAIPPANNVDLLAETIVLNYLALHGDVARFEQIFPNHGLGGPSSLDNLIAFQAIR